jgi:hypothetical protein
MRHPARTNKSLLSAFASTRFVQSGRLSNCRSSLPKQNQLIAAKAAQSVAFHGSLLHASSNELYASRELGELHHTIPARCELDGTAPNKKYPLRSRALRWLVCSALRAEDARVAQAGRLFLCSSGRRCGHIDGTLRRGHLIKLPLHFGLPSTSGISHVVRKICKCIFAQSALTSCQ